MIKKKILHPEYRYAKSPSEDLSLQVNLDKEEKLLREGDRTIILDIAELYRKERNESTKYKIYGKVNVIFKNLYSGTTTYNALRNTLYDLNDGLDSDWTGYLPYDEFAFIRKDVVREVSTTTGSTIGDYQITTTLTGNTDHTTITELDANKWNWNFYLSYVFEHDENYPIKYTLSGSTVYDFTSGDGIPFRVMDMGSYYELTSPLQHNMSQGEYVILSGSTIGGGTELSRCFGISSVGNRNYNSSRYTIILNKSDFTSSQVLNDGVVVFGKRCLDKSNITQTTSKYYVHKHKTITKVDDCIIDNAGFEIPVFENERKLQYETSDGRNDVLVEKNRPESILYHFKNGIDIKNLTNNLGYNVTKLYLTTIFRNGNGYFNYPPRLGWRFNLHNSWVDEQFNSTFTSSNTNLPYTVSGNTFSQGNEIPTGTTIVGSFVEYNEIDFKETILSDTYHKITYNTSIFDHGQTNTSRLNGVTSDNPSGLIYQPHYEIKIRELSPYVETSDTDDIFNLPENTKYDDINSIWKWRDLYDHGYIDPDGFGTNFPFTNGQHYVKKDINFLLKNEQTFLNRVGGIRNFTNDPNSLC